MRPIFCKVSAIGSLLYMTTTWGQCLMVSNQLKYSSYRDILIIFDAYSVACVHNQITPPNKGVDNSMLKKVSI